MVIKLAKLLILLLVVFTLFLNLINVAFVKNYENTYNKYNRTIISNAGDNTSNLGIACQNINQPIEEYLIYKKNATWSFLAIIILLAIIVIEFALAKSKTVLFSSESWKYLKVMTLAMFLSSFLFVYAFWVMADDSYLHKCLNVEINRENLQD